MQSGPSRRHSGPAGDTHGSAPTTAALVRVGEAVRAVGCDGLPRGGGARRPSIASLLGEMVGRLVEAPREGQPVNGPCHGSEGLQRTCDNAMDLRMGRAALPGAMPHYWQVVAGNLQRGVGRPVGQHKVDANTEAPRFGLHGRRAAREADAGRGQQGPLRRKVMRPPKGGTRSTAGDGTAAGGAVKCEAIVHVVACKPDDRIRGMRDQLLPRCDETTGCQA